MHRRLPPLLTRSFLASVSGLGLLIAFGAGNASAARVPTSHSAASTSAAARAALEHLLIGEHATNHAVSGHGITAAHVQSNNWSGYADTGKAGTFTKVSASWTEPKATCTSKTSLAAFWVGIDGYSSGTVEQDGTLIYCKGGSPHYYSWWEMYPRNDVQLVGDTVKPGDKIAASVVRSGTSYALKVTDSTTSGNNVSETETCSAAKCKDTSAEWIAEAPSGSKGIYPLSDFGTWTPSSDDVTGGGKSGTISSFTDDSITMVNGTTGKTEAKPGPLNSAGNEFTDTWESA